MKKCVVKRADGMYLKYPWTRLVWCKEQSKAHRLSLRIGRGVASVFADPSVFVVRLGRSKLRAAVQKLTLELDRWKHDAALLREQRDEARLLLDALSRNSLSRTSQGGHGAASVSNKENDDE